MDTLLHDLAEWVGQVWARRWLEHLRRSQEEQETSDQHDLENQANHDAGFAKTMDDPASRNLLALNMALCTVTRPWIPVTTWRIARQSSD
jgi:hypothetical protein